LNIPFFTTFQYKIYILLSLTSNSETVVSIIWNNLCESKKK